MGMTIINNYKMPSNCYMCDLHNYHECDLTGESIEEDYCWNGDSREKHCPLREVDAIPKAEVRKLLRDNAENISGSILDIVKEEYIPKSQYENRLKADMVAMLEDLRLDFQEAELAGVLDNKELIFADEVDDLVQQKINSLEGEIC